MINGPRVPEKDQKTNKETCLKSDGFAREGLNEDLHFDAPLPSPRKREEQNRWVRNANTRLTRRKKGEHSTRSHAYLRRKGTCSCMGKV